MLGGMGGGDVKMFAGIGAWVGPGRVTEVFAAAAIIGMLIVVYQAVRDGRLATLSRNSAVIVLNAATVGDLSCPAEPEPRPGERRRLPYAVPTLVATLILLSSGRRWL